MDYSNLLSKAWNTVWNNKFLIGLGVLVALGSGGGSSGNSGSSFNSSGSSGGGTGSGPDVCEGLNQSFQSMGAEGTAIIGIFVALFCFFFLIGLVFWFISRVAQGGLINGVDEIENGRPTGFVAAWTAGWRKVWQLLGIGAIAGIPGFLMFVVIVVLGVMLLTTTDWESVCFAMASGDPQQYTAIYETMGMAWLIGLLVCCPLFLLSWGLQAVQAFADRACMTEGKGILDSYSRGWEVLRQNLGQVVVLFLIQVALGIGLSIVLAIPVFIASICCFLWPLLLVLSGTGQAYFSTLWTLAWRQWVGPRTGEPPAPEIPSSTPAPAV